MNDLLSVIVPTYNPHAGRLQQTLDGLRMQTLPVDEWELIIIDNNSCPPVEAELDWHPHASIVTETKQGLTYARIKGFDTATGGLIVMVDDDNILDPGYLTKVKQIFATNRKLGASGGKSFPLYESLPPSWIKAFEGSLAIRDLGDEVLIADWQHHYPNCAPLGAGMALRAEALHSYREKIRTQNNVISDRTATSLGSGGDNDIVLEILKSGWQVGYFPVLSLQHIIPAGRLEVSYLARLEKESNHSWVILLYSHGINPWKKISRVTLPLRKLKSWLNMKAGFSMRNYIKWQGYCGMVDALADIGDDSKPMITIEPIGGLANRMRVIASGIWLRDQLNTALMVIWNKNAELDAPFDALFKPIPGVTLIDKPAKYRYLRRSNQPAALKAKIINRLMGIHYVLHEADFPDLIWPGKLDIENVARNHETVYIQTCQEFGKNLYAYRYFKPIATVKEHVNRLINDFTGHTVGVHIRRTDHQMAIQNSPLELFIDAMTQALADNPDTKFYVSSDDAAVKEILTGLFPGKIITGNFTTGRTSIAGMQGAVTDMYCLAATRYLIGSYWSSFSDVAASINQIELKIIKANRC